MLRDGKAKDSDVLFFLEKLLLGRTGIHFGLRMRERKLSVSLALVWSGKYGKGTAKRSKLEAEDFNDSEAIKDYSGFQTQ